MDKRKVIAIIEVDADTAFEAIDDGPVPYLEQAVPKIDGCSLVDAFISDEDEDDQQQAYLNYLVEWAFNHQGEDLKGAQPISFDKFCENECPRGGDSTNDCEGCDYSGDYHCVNGECVERGDPHTETKASNIRELIYERYKLHWMATHGYSLSQMVEELQNLSDESADGDSVTELFDEWELMHGFGGAIWPGQSEFFDNEYKEPAVVSPLLYTTEERLAYLKDIETLRKGD